VIRVTEPRHKLTARDLMTADVVTVPAGSSLAEAIAIMDRHGYSQLPVMRDGKPEALLTEADIRRALLENQTEQTVDRAASALPAAVEPRARLSHVLALLQEQETVLVIDTEGGLAGIVTYWDILVTAQPALLVQEVELILRRVVSSMYQEKYGADWWDQIPKDLRQRAEEEHKADRDEAATPEHMLGHTSLWSLIEIFRHIRPNIDDHQFDRLHRIRELRNMVAHLYVLSAEELREIRQICPAAGDWLISLLPPHAGLRT
jgi:CBS domain-containing protein